MDPPRHSAICVSTRQSGDNKECGLHSWHTPESGNTHYDTIPTRLSYQVLVSYYTYFTKHTQQNIQKNSWSEDLNTDKDIPRCLVAEKQCMHRILLHQDTSHSSQFILKTCVNHMFFLAPMQGIFKTPVAVSAQLIHSYHDSCLGESCPLCKGT